MCLSLFLVLSSSLAEILLFFCFCYVGVEKKWENWLRSSTNLKAFVVCSWLSLFLGLKTHFLEVGNLFWLDIFKWWLRGRNNRAVHSHLNKPWRGFSSHQMLTTLCILEDTLNLSAFTFHFKETGTVHLNSLWTVMTGCQKQTKKLLQDDLLDPAAVMELKIAWHILCGLPGGRTNISTLLI